MSRVNVATVRAVTGNNGVCNFTPTPGPCYSPEGEINSTTIMANVLYDFGNESWTIRPFVGLGAGVNRVKTETVGNLRDNRCQCCERIWSRHRAESGK